MNLTLARLRQTTGALAAIAVVSMVLPYMPAGLGTPSLQAQRNPYETGPPSAALLRRLASSADAFRNGDTVYVVASEVFPHEVVDVYMDFERARFVADSAGLDFGVFGPFVTPPDSAPEMPQLPLAVVLCYKDDITTRYVCPPLAGGPGDPVFRMENVDSINVTVFSRERGPVSVNMTRPPSTTVYTLDAFDRFIAPYYLRLFGPEVVLEMRQEMIDYIREGLGLGR